MSTIL